MAFNSFPPPKVKTDKEELLPLHHCFPYALLLSCPSLSALLSPCYLAEGY
jgi:hypothetical protein